MTTEKPGADQNAVGHEPTDVMCVRHMRRAAFVECLRVRYNPSPDWKYRTEEEAIEILVGYKS